MKYTHTSNLPSTTGIPTLPSRRPSFKLLDDSSRRDNYTRTSLRRRKREAKGKPARQPAPNRDRPRPRPGARATRRREAIHEKFLHHHFGRWPPFSPASDRCPMALSGTRLRPQSRATACNGRVVAFGCRGAASGACCSGHEGGLQHRGTLPLGGVKSGRGNTGLPGNR